MSRHPCFATYLHPETMATARPPETIAFVGYSWPHFAQIRQALVERTSSYPSLPMRIASLDTFHGGGYKLFDWDHQAVRAWAEERLAQGDRAELRSGYAKLSGESSYDVMARRYLAVSGLDDPRYDDLLRGFFVTAHPDFRIIRSALFTRCEQEDGEDAYTARLAAALEGLSVGYAPQHLLVAGHMATPGGHTVVAARHLRLASGAHAHPAASRAYLLFDTRRSIDSIDDLLAGLQPIE
jgi:hypothetical protein